MDNRSIQGFTLIELLVVISIIGLFSSVALASFSEARLSAQYTKARLDIKTLANLVDMAKGNGNRTLHQITGSYCSECACRSPGFALPITVSLHTLPNTHPCFTSYYSLVSLLNNNTGGLYAMRTPPLDPWGVPYLINENEGEVLGGGCVVDCGPCAYDNITSAGPNGLYYDTDDVTYNIPSLRCPNPITHHVNTNWY